MESQILYRVQREDLPQLKELLGHTPIQVIAGAVLGVAVGLLGSYFLI